MTLCRDSNGLAVYAVSRPCRQSGAQKFWSDGDKILREKLPALRPFIPPLLLFAFRGSLFSGGPMPKRLFLLSDNGELAKAQISVIVEAIPDDWDNKVYGFLRATQNMIDIKEALPSTCITFGSSICQMVRGTLKSDSNERQEPDIFGVIIEGKNPTEVLFGWVSRGSEVLSLEEAKKFVVHFIKKGYRGRIQFNYRYGINTRDDSHIHCRCEILLETKNSCAIPRLKLEWGSDATENRHLPILQVCERLKLRELDATVD